MGTRRVNSHLEAHVLWPACITLNHANQEVYPPPSQALYSYPMLKTTMPSKDSRLTTPSPYKQSQIAPHPKVLPETPDVRAQPDAEKSNVLPGTGVYFWK